MATPVGSLQVSDASYSVAPTTSQTVVVSVDGTGTAADIKAYVLPTP